MKELGEARNSFIQWPRNAIVFTKVSKSQHITQNEGNSRQSLGLARSSQASQETRKQTTLKKPTQYVKSVIPVQTLSKRPKELQSLYKRWESRSNPRQGIEVKANPTVFGAQSIDFMIFRDDIHSLVQNEWLDHTIIAWFQMFLHGILQTKEKNRCGFIFPAHIHSDECLLNTNGVISSITSAMSHNRELWFFLAPYLQSNHWSLLIIFPRRRTTYILDSLMSKEKTVDFYIIKEHVEALLAYVSCRAVTMYQEKGGVCDTDKSRPFRWELLNCNQQKSSWECGYYIMHFMFNFVMYHQSQFPNRVHEVKNHVKYKKYTGIKVGGIDCCGNRKDYKSKLNNLSFFHYALEIRILISEESPDTDVDQGSLYPDKSSGCHTKLSSLLSLSSVFRSRACWSCHQLILRLR
ncbi:hypothetical protein OSB04_011078 [Centaurea solstitialis]|uniref:Ubiquitin-like protease family profile domain-containing protein n=1 Tax=Centaurea solstitialis TaxID=347529 RepID=A0AA38TAG6_9ASTR|nr:hypothetical protein OSB04_011078 [Centaurea solstitialis]